MTEKKSWLQRKRRICAAAMAAMAAMAAQKDMCESKNIAY